MESRDSDRWDTDLAAGITARQYPDLVKAKDRPKIADLINSRLG